MNLSVLKHFGRTNTGFVGHLSSLGRKPFAVRLSAAKPPVSALALVVVLGVSACGQSAGPAPGAQTVATRPAPAAAATSGIAWPGMAPATAAPPTPGSTERVAPVSSMVDGLRARLEESPNDPKGWALLAQSYAFMGNQKGVEEALARAVALGMNEEDLRQRVQAATPKAQPQTDWVQQALNR